MDGLYSIKPWFGRRLRPVEDALVRRRVDADVVTVAGLAASVLAGGAIAVAGALEAPFVWLAVPPLLIGRLAANALDGSVAQRTGRARPFGTVINEVGDRLSDAAIIGGTVTVVGTGVALGALAAAFLASLVGVLALALTGRRDSGGPMGKADRVAVLAIAALAGGLAGSAVPVSAAVWVIAAGSVVTAVLRILRLRVVLATPSAEVHR